MQQIRMSYHQTSLLKKRDNLRFKYCQETKQILKKYNLKLNDRMRSDEKLSTRWELFNTVINIDDAITLRHLLSLEHQIHYPLESGLREAVKKGYYHITEILIAYGGKISKSLIGTAFFFNRKDILDLLHKTSGITPVTEKEYILWMFHDDI